MKAYPKKRGILGGLCWCIGWILLATCLLWATFTSSLIPSNWVVILGLVATFCVTICLMAMERSGIVARLPWLRSIRFPSLMILLASTIGWLGLCVWYGFWMLACLFGSGCFFLGSELLNVGKPTDKADTEAK